MSIVLGFSCTSHDSSAALFIDGQLVAAIAEERMNRQKSSGKSIPQRAIAEVLRLGRVGRRDVTHVAMMSGYYPEEYFAWISGKREAYRKLKRLSRRLRNKSTELIWTGHNDREAREAGVTLESRFRKELFLEREGFVPTTGVSFHPHHSVHALLAGFYSGFDECLTVTADGYGDLDEAHMASIYRHGQLETLSVTHGVGRSAGLFYMTITELLGFRPVRHEGKVLGLAAFGDPKPLLETFRRCLRLEANGMVFDSDFNDPQTAHQDRYAYLKAAIAGHSRENVAAAAQQALEDSYVAHIKELVKRTGLRRVAMNGGVAANVKLNQRVAQLPEVEKIFVFPGMSDTGNSIGAALFALEKEQPGFLAKHQHAMVDAYLGPEYSDAAIEQELNLHKLRYEKLDQTALVEHAAQAMHDGLVVGWFQGRMEFGPRALGNRSMVGRPTGAEINKALNDRLERTEFMPFAPSVLAERADEIFVGVDKAAHPAEFMTVTFDVREEWKARIPAVVHVDGTARPQLVRADRNPLYHALIKRYSELSGIPLVLNTSFNVHEEPIVCAPEEGVRALREDRIDALAIGPYWIVNPLLAQKR
ncbi:MAG TPA: carbamoyltransferase C-terminal domain-containing protein [Rhodocyclaceae bacterium]|nr:carbamoyltransferase C-terminal domain-containing protein [Rhodocyclaceae bacterium]